MKRLVLSLVFCFTFLSNYAQDIAFKTDGIGAIFGIYRVGSEFKIKDSQTIDFSVAYVSSNMLDLKGYATTIGYKRYVKEAFKGWYANPVLSFAQVKDLREKEYYMNFENPRAEVLSLGIRIGYQYLFSKEKSSWLINPFFSTEFSMSDYTKFNGMGIGFGLQIGYFFKKDKEQIK